LGKKSENNPIKCMVDFINKKIVFVPLVQGYEQLNILEKKLRRQITGASQLVTKSDETESTAN
jgi:hypothetical protein